MAGIVAASQSGAVFGQESLRNALEFDRVNQTRAQNFQNQNYNLKLGPVLVNTSAATSLSYNDNINLIGGPAQEDDIILRPSAQVGLFWQVTDHSRLALDTSVGYSYYFLHPEHNHLDISPGTTSDISYDLAVGAIRFNLHDRFSYTQNPMQYGTAAVSGTTELGRFRNAAGINGAFRLPDTTLSAGYDHSNVIHFNDAFENSNYSSETVFFRATYTWDPTLDFGVEVSAGLTDYEQSFRPDNRNYTAGPFATWKVTETISTTVRGGLSGYDLTSSSALGDTAAPLSFYASADIQHRASPWFDHALIISRDTSQGIGVSANFLEVLSVQYNARFNVIKNISLGANLFYEISDDTSQGGTALLLAESYSRYGGGVSIGYRIMERLNSSLNFTHTEKDSDLAGFDYGQNVVTLSLGYHF